MQPKKKLDLEFFQKAGKRGGKIAASKMTKAERTARARKAGKKRQEKARSQKGGTS
jgi:hypothetical protein